MKHGVLCCYEILHVSVAVVPDLPVVNSGGVLQIQSHSLSTETLFQLSQSTALLAAICLQDRSDGSETTEQTEQKRFLQLPCIHYSV